MPIVIICIIVIRMQCVEKVKTALSGRVSRQRFISSITFTSNKTRMSLLDTSHLPGFFWRFSACGIKNAQFSIYLHFICCTVMQRIKEAVAVKPTLKSLRDEISFLQAGFDAPLHPGVYRIERGFFFLMCGCIYTCVYERMWVREKNYEENPMTRSSGQFCASCVTLFVELHTCVTSVIL